MAYGLSPLRSGSDFMFSPAAVFRTWTYGAKRPNEFWRYSEEGGGEWSPSIPTNETSS